MPRWLLWSFGAVLCWGLWAVISKLIGDALTAAQSQALSTLGLVPVVIALVVSKTLTASGGRRPGLGGTTANPPRRPKPESTPLYFKYHQESDCGFFFATI